MVKKSKKTHTKQKTNKYKNTGGTWHEIAFQWQWQCEEKRAGEKLGVSGRTDL